MAGMGDKLAPCLQTVVSKSARVAEAERTIYRLEQENSRLLQELNDVRSLYKQLTTESTHEFFDERRVNLLKSQVIQLERQNSLLTDRINGHSQTLMEADNALAAALDYCQSFKERFGVGRVSCSELDTILSMLQSARKRLTEKTSSLHGCSKPLLWYAGFLQNRPDQPVTLLDVFQGDIEHINLKHVSRLESKLVNLYKELMLVNNTLRICLQSSSADDVICATPTAVYSRLSDQVQHSCDLLQDVCSQLLQLSLLVPAAPLPALSNPMFESLTVENVMKIFGKSAKTYNAKRLIHALMKYVNVSVNHAGIENQLLLEELEFYHAVYKVEMQYAESLLPAINKCYAEFESDMQEVICEPLGEVLQVFDELKDSADNQSLLHFIEVFRNHAPGLSEAVQRLSVNVGSQSDKACQFSEYGTQFMKRMKYCHTECKRKRDALIAELDTVKQQLSEQTKELMQIISEKDQHLNGKMQVHQDIQTLCKSSSDQKPIKKSVERKCTPSEYAGQLEATSTAGTVHKVNDFVTFSDDVKTSAVTMPSPVAEVSYCSLALPKTAVSNMTVRPTLCTQVRSRKKVPGTVQQTLFLKPNHDNVNCSDM